MRVENWPSLLNEYLSTTEPFAWGSNDCALWAAGWVYLCTEKDFRGDWIGTYSTARGAKMRMKKLGFCGVEGIADAHLVPKPASLAQRGDLVSHQGALGICNGIHSHFLTADGMTTVPTLSCLTAWAV